MEKLPLTQVIVLMGVSGSGKTTVGRQLAAALGWTFADADDYHPEANRQKMSAGVALSDEDRAPWLARLRVLIESHLARAAPLVLASSALKARYRMQLQAEPQVQLVYLRGTFETIRRRIEARQGHFMPPALLRSQFDALEEPSPSEALVVSIELTPTDIVAAIRAGLAL